MMDKKEIKDSLKLLFDKTVFIIEFVVSLLLIITMLTTILVVQSEGKIDITLCAITIILLIVFVAIIYYIFKTRKNVVEKMFLAIAIPLSVAFAIFVLPLHVPDEGTHIIKAYDISVGNLLTSKDQNGEYTSVIVNGYQKLPYTRIKNYEDIINELQKDTNYSEVTYEASSAQAYSPFLYIGPSVAFIISRIFGINFFFGIYLGRIFNAIIFLAFSYFAIKKIPIGKLVLAICLCMPIMLQQAASCSADSILNAVLIYYIAHIVYMVFKKEKIIKKDIIVLFVLTAFMAMFKYVYILVAGLLFIGIFKKKEERKTFIKTSIIMIIIGAIFSVGWFIFSQKYAAQEKSLEEYCIAANVNPTQQVSAILKNPGQLINALFNHYSTDGAKLVGESIGLALGWYEFEINQILIYIYIAIIILSAVLEKNSDKLTKGAKIWSILIVFGVVILIASIMYAVFTPVGYPVIRGDQGRYYAPLIIILGLCFIRKDRENKNKNINEYMIMTSFILNFLVLMQVMSGYLL